MARHAARRGSRSRWLLILLVVAIIAAGAVAALTLRHPDTHRGVGAPPPSSASGITTTTAAAAAPCGTQVNVVTAQSFATPLKQIADATTGANCVRVNVTVADGQAAIDKVASSKPDVWIPDDTSWTSLATVPLDLDNKVVVASSPVYALTRKADGAPPAAIQTWPGLAQALSQQGAAAHLVATDPADSGAGMVPLGVLSAAVGKIGGPYQSALELVRAWQGGRVVTHGGSAFPDKAGDIGLVPEYACLQAKDASEYNVVAPSDGTALMRYTLVATADAAGNPTRAANVARLRSALTAPSAASALASAGLRPPAWPSSAPPSEVSAILPHLSAAPFAVVGQHYLWHVLSTWHPDQRRSNVLIVVDISGSMRDPAPGSTTPLIDLVRAGLTQVNNLLPDNSELGLWQFGFQLDPPHDYQSLVPPAPLDAGQRGKFTAAITSLQARSTGTALYATILAAYQQQQADFRKGLPTEVLLFTDGVDQDAPGSVDIGQLKAQLAAADPAKHVQLAVLGFGDQIPVAALTDALQPVHGEVDHLVTADDVLAAFVHAVSGGLTHPAPH
jgi:Bacterial extracellular solute-binding protein/von Willebrand factor type A domain